MNALLVGLVLGFAGGFALAAILAARRIRERQERYGFQLAVNEKMRDELLYLRGIVGQYEREAAELNELERMYRREA